MDDEVCLGMCLYPVNVEADGQVFPFAFFGRGSLLFLLEADEHLILYLLHIKHILGRERTT